MTDKKPTYSLDEVVALIEEADQCKSLFERNTMLAILASVVVSDKHLYSLKDLWIICIMINDRQKGIINWKE
jgi:hypothetical protein